MYNLDLKQEDYPIIIKPNMGHPVLINLREYKDEKGIINKQVFFEALIITIPDQKVKEILDFFHLNIYIQPILKDEGDFEKRRGERYPLQISEIEKIEEMDFDEEQDILKEETCVEMDLYENVLQIDNIFGERKNLYRVKFQIKQIKEIDTIFKDFKRSSVLCDIVHDLPNRIENKINYHSIAIFDKDWANFKFIHATDLHIAYRNDVISKYLKDKAKKKIQKRKDSKLRPLKKIPFILKRDFDFKFGFQEDKIKELATAKYNFNYSLRKLIKYINEQVKQNELDFVLFTGDLVDFVEIAKSNNLYKNNFFVFIEILLGLNRGLDDNPEFIDGELINKQEIFAPIFTIVGNHDYRKGHYSLSFDSFHKIFGMTNREVKGYDDIKFHQYYKILFSRNKFLKTYFRYLNPNLNYKVKIGDFYDFIFLDTGQDSIADMHDLIKGAPSTKGLKDYQIDLLRSYIKLSQDNKIVIVMHTPPVSPNLSYFKRRKLRGKFGLKRKLEWSDFYEANLKNYIGDSRLDKIINLKYQTIMYNWADLLKILTGSDKIIKRKVDLILCGHTHTLKEFRLKEARGDETEFTKFGFYGFPVYIEIPCEIYTSRYRDVLKTFKNPLDLKSWFDVNKPFIFQTQALGPLSYKAKFKPPGFRYFTIKDNQITNVDVYSLHLKEELE